MAKKNKVTQVRRAYIQSLAEKTGKTSTEDKAKFRQRFEKLATTPSGRAKIQQVTGLSGVRKNLRAAYSAPKSKTSTNNTKNTGSSLPGFGVAAKRTYTEAQTETAFRSNPMPYKAPVQKYSVDVVRTPVSASQSSGLSNAQKVLLVGGGAGVGALALRRMRLDAIDRANQAKAAAAKKAAASAPKASSKPKVRTTTGPRSTSLSARAGAGVRGGQYGQGGRGGGGSLKRTK
jgi:hypothetical protein